MVIVFPPYGFSCFQTAVALLSFPVTVLLVLSAHQVKTEEQIAAEQAWYGSEKVWLVHKDGFSLGEMNLPVFAC